MKYFAKKNEYESQNFYFKVSINGQIFDAMGYYNPNSIEGGIREKAFQIQRYLKEMYPHREFLVSLDNYSEKGLCVASFDLMSYARYRKNPISAYIPVWNDELKSAQFKVW